MDKELLAKILSAGVKDCRATPYNVASNRLGDTLLAMLRVIKPEATWMGDIPDGH